MRFHFAPLFAVSLDLMIHFSSSYCSYGPPHTFYFLQGSLQFRSFCVTPCTEPSYPPPWPPLVIALQPATQALTTFYQDDLLVGSAPPLTLNRTSTLSTVQWTSFHDHPTHPPPPTPHRTHAEPNILPRSQSIQHTLPTTTGHDANGPPGRQHLPSSTLAPICPGRAWTPRTISY